MLHYDWTNNGGQVMINDTYGHQAGDEVLKKVANSVSSAIHGKGNCYRYGGDEMTVLLPNRDIQAAKAVAEQIRSGIEQLRFELCSERATASIGLTSYPDLTKNLDEVFLDADAMMYKAKDSGGNGVQSAGSSEVSQDSVRFMRIDIASRLEGVNLWMRLLSGNDRHFSAVITNDSDEDVTVEAITLKKDKVYLSEPSKPRATDDWKIRKRSSQTITWEARIPPVMRLRSKEPNHKSGQIMEIDVVVWGRVLGRLKTFSHTILALVEYGNSSISEFC